MTRRPLLAFLTLAILGLASSAAWADISGKYRIIRNDGGVVVGEVKQEGDVYIVNVGKGITVRMQKSEVRAMQKIEQPEASAKLGDQANGGGLDKNALDKEGDLSDDDVKKLIGDDDLGPDIDPEQDVMPKLDTNTESVEEMKRIAGTKNVLETDHFVLVYTSTREVALKLAQRLEKIYWWNYKFMQLMNLTPKRPKYRLEIYFFGDHKEFQAYQSLDADVSIYTLGYFMPPRNRSAFFDLDTWPFIVNYKEQLKHASPQDRRRITNLIRRWRDFKNLEVIQHEASHHIHFNMGVFNPDPSAFPPRWLAEGLAMMFELPPGKAGAGLAAVNNYRLNEFQETFGRYSRFPVPLRTFVIDDRLWFQGYNYPLGWAIVNYLYRKFPDKFKLYMQKIGAREDGTQIDMTQKQTEFEDLFGEVNDKWIENFFKFYMEQHVLRSELPPGP